MLYLTRKPGEAVLINQDIEVRVIEVRGRTVKLGFSYPVGATVVREEIAGPIGEANREAVAAVRNLPGHASADGSSGRTRGDRTRGEGG